MAQARKDDRGRVLRKGEVQRNDGRYSNLAYTPMYAKLYANCYRGFGILIIIGGDLWVAYKENSDNEEFRQIKWLNDTRTSLDREICLMGFSCISLYFEFISLMIRLIFIFLFYKCMFQYHNDYDIISPQGSTEIREKFHAPGRYR